jgi:hypothetical protein
MLSYVDKHGRKRGLFCYGCLGSRDFFYQVSPFLKSKLAWLRHCFISNSSRDGLVVRIAGWLTGKFRGLLSYSRWKETRSPWIVTPYTDITASIEPADQSSRYNLLRRRSDNPDFVTQVCVSYSTKGKGTDTLMHFPAFRSLSTSLAPKMSVLIVTNEWHRAMIQWSTTRTNHEDWTPSFPWVNASHPPSPRGRARQGW